MRSLHRYHVVPHVPERLAALEALGKNLRWTWHRPTRELFARIDPALFASVAENPIALLGRVPEARLEELARDGAFVAELDRLRGDLDAYLARETWFSRTFGAELGGARVAYFSMEFGVHECVPVYSGGLGVLAGDHLKSSSDLGVPLVGVGIAFSQGYFRQSLDENGWQHERYPLNDWHDLPVTEVRDASGARVRVRVALPASHDGSKKQEVVLEALRVDVGRVPLFLLDANVDDNAPELRALTNTLYGGDRVHRIRQEILLGVGGVRLLEAIGLTPTICHMNEGHSAFLALERVRQIMREHGATYPVAIEVAAAGNAFTTHTPVPAGNDAFPRDLVLPYVAVLAEGLGKTAEEVLRMGRVDEHHGELSMPVLAMRLAERYNGVSLLHGREARAMWNVLWPGVPEDEVPIGAITNGVHAETWTADAFADLYARHLGESFAERAADPETWAAVASIPDEELWAVHERCRERLVARVRERMHAAAARRHQVGDHGEPERLDPRALTIGFARRFATYKRGALLLRDPARLARILADADRPVQLVFSGKAHPQDWGGKELIHAIVRASRDEAFRGRIVFVEDYDMGVARDLVAGVDVWLNTPRRPLEASGTSGMKACLNGVLHASVLDGWWCEAHAEDRGFSIGRGEEYADPDHADRVEAEALYRLLEEAIVPSFYDRDSAGLPRAWIAKMKRSIAAIGPAFNTHRMVEQYTRDVYAPAARRIWSMTADHLAGARALAAWKARVREAWPEVRVAAVSPRPTRIVIGSEIAVTADVHLGALSPAEVAVELWHGPVDATRGATRGAPAPMRCIAELGAGSYRFEGQLGTAALGEHAFAVRVLPSHPGLSSKLAAGLVCWSA